MTTTTTAATTADADTVSASRRPAPAPAAPPDLPPAVVVREPRLSEPPAVEGDRPSTVRASTGRIRRLVARLRPRQADRRWHHDERFATRTWTSQRSRPIARTELDTFRHF